MSDYRTTFSDRGGGFNTNFNDGNRFKTSFKEGGGLASGQILVNTTKGWNSQIQLMSKVKTIYIYVDHDSYIDDDGKEIWLPGFKIGDGKTYLIDLPFTDTLVQQHINDEVIHVTSAEKEFWNNKNRAYVDGENITLTIY